KLVHPLHGTSGLGAGLQLDLSFSSITSSSLNWSSICDFTTVRSILIILSLTSKYSFKVFGCVFKKDWSFSPSAFNILERPISSIAIEDNNKLIVSHRSKLIIGVIFGIVGKDINIPPLFLFKGEYTYSVLKTYEFGE